MSQFPWADATGTLKPGTRIADRYRFVKLLGQGGMGQVLEVEHEDLGRRFALKILRLEVWSDELLHRFKREARALGRVTGARVVQVTDSGVDAMLGPYYVMELLDGETLSERLHRDGRLRWDVAVPLFVELCEALAEVHAASIVHRDLKPSNVGLMRAGPVPVKLLDFGLAAIVEESYTERITRSQQYVGTLPYMAPEQFKGVPPSPSMDLYALGVLLYETLAGRLPFASTFPATLIQEHLFEPPPPFAVAAPGVVVPAWLDAIVMRLLAKDMTRRYGSPSLVAEALRAGEMGVAATPTAAKAVPAPALSKQESAPAGRVSTKLVELPLSGTSATDAARAVAAGPSIPPPQAPVTGPPSPVPATGRVSVGRNAVATGSDVIVLGASRRGVLVGAVAGTALALVVLAVLAFAHFGGWRSGARANDGDDARAVAPAQPLAPPPSTGGPEPQRPPPSPTSAPSVSTAPSAAVGAGSAPRAVDGSPAAGAHDLAGKSPAPRPARQRPGKPRDRDKPWQGEVILDPEQ